MPDHCPDHCNVWTISPGVAFLDGLVTGLLEGKLVPGFDPEADPFALNSVTLYLPTRRAVRAVRENFLNRLGRAVLLPQIRPIGDIDEDDIAFKAGFANDVSNIVSPAVDHAERQLFLTQLILRWSSVMERQRAGLGDEAQLVPASPADAAYLAELLADLIDAVATGEADWSALNRIVPEELAGYWEITLHFLRIATHSWPKHLQERGLCDPGTRRDRLIRLEAERLTKGGSAGPVIAAGSTGSVPATAQLLAAISRLPNGAVVLPGLDLELDDTAWATIANGRDDPVLTAHPQFGLARLLAVLGVARDQVRPLGDLRPDLSRRGRFVSQAMRPAETTDTWSAAQETGLNRAEALDGIGLINATNEREEALAIAVVLRGCLEKEGHVAALVTPDRRLARRVISELQRWNVRVDDSAGQPLSSTPIGVLARLAAEVAISGGAEKILALLLHPEVTLGWEAHEVRHAARALERAVLRGPRLIPGSAALGSALAKARALSEDRGNGSEGRRQTRAAAGLSEDAWDDAMAIADRLAEAVRPLEELATSGNVHSLKALLKAHWTFLQALCAPAGSSAGFPLNDEAGQGLAGRFVELFNSAGFAPDIVARDYPAFFEAIVGGTPVRPSGADPRIHIWGALEARLQHVDTIVIGGLNEGTWPRQVKLDPFLSRHMRQTLELEAPERRTGLAAHDFTQALGHDRVWLTRSEREDGEPKVESRWLQRLLALSGSAATDVLSKRGDVFLRLARALEQQAKPVAGGGRPCPAPALALRPRSLPVTAIETLIRDPYAVFARHVLKLMAFEPLAEQPGAAERGSLFHAALERIVAERPSGPFDDAALDDLISHGHTLFRPFEHYPEIGALWWPRFDAVARWFIAEEAGRQARVETRMTEVKGRLDVSPDFALTVRADRVDLLNDGHLSIIDYKTGAPPSNDQVLSTAPQLLLEALIAEAGEFKDVDPGRVGELIYYHLKGTGAGGVARPTGFREERGGKPAVTLDEAKRLTSRRLSALADYYADPANGYLSRKIPRRQNEWLGDYDHLARVAEWSVGADDE